MSLNDYSPFDVHRFTEKDAQKEGYGGEPSKFYQDIANFPDSHFFGHTTTTIGRVRRSSRVKGRKSVVTQEGVKMTKAISCFPESSKVVQHHGGHVDEHQQCDDDASTEEDDASTEEDDASTEEDENKKKFYDDDNDDDASTEEF